MTEMSLENRIKYDILNSIAKGQDRIDNLLEYKNNHNKEYGEVADMIKNNMYVRGHFNIVRTGRGNDRKINHIEIKHAELTERGIAALNQLRNLK